MYSFNSRIRYSEVNAQDQLTMYSVLNYFQDCSSFQTEDLEVGLDYLGERNLAWILISWQIEVNRYPKQCEEITISTWPTSFKGFFGKRNYQMKDQKGNVVAYADSLWILMDMSTGRPAKIEQEILEKYQLDPPIEMTPAPRKIAVPQEMQSKEAFPVLKFHLDTNYHVNNGKYIQMALEYVPDDFVPGQMRVEYKKSALYGEMVYPQVKETENMITVVLADREGNTYTVVELERKHD